jgi:hypothetical protein
MAQAVELWEVMIPVISRGVKPTNGDPRDHSYTVEPGFFLLPTR